MEELHRKIQIHSLLRKICSSTDYTDLNNGKKLNLSLLKIPAKIQPSKGSIFLNPGGPGNGALDFMAGSGPLVSIMTGGHHDLIGVDPRGTGDTLLINCYPKPIDRLLSSSLFFPNSSDAALDTVWASLQQYAETCCQNAKGVSELIGTAFVARDMMQVVDALSEDGMLRYWGQSYGTYLGATLAAMFPERIDKMVMDGVLNPHEYTTGWEYDIVPGGDIAFKKFLEACVNAGTKCALAKQGATVESLTTKVYNLLEEAKYNPIVMGSNATTDRITVEQLLISLNVALRVAIGYSIPLAGYLDAVLERNKTAYDIYRPIISPDAGSPYPGNADNILAIHCGDTTFRSNNLEELKPRVERLLKSGKLSGDVYTFSFLACSLWKFRAKRRYEGNFKVKTKNPMLLIGSPYDLRTPLAGAQNASAGFENSVVLQHNGLGHCVLYSPGQCAIRATRDYFVNGTLPHSGTVCEPDFDVFSGKKIIDSFSAYL
ncbi:TAP-like protein-domain-containing protein [Phaeosphaeriaceae sp. PMI808]|nr:TAP-like protein-domain-containing protein [Phaeosphaeriaceae sp. PMI808]